MLKSITSSLYKLFKDRPFRVTMIIGVILAITLTFMYNSILQDGVSGSYMLLIAGSPSNNFGIAVPINLVTFIIGEYTYGTIRNKIIAGNRRRNIYISLLISNIIFSFLLMFVYVGLSVTLGSILGGWGNILTDAKEIWCHIIITVLVYILLSSLALLMATLIRHQGLAITATTLVLVSGLITAAIYFSANGDDVTYGLFGINPLSYHTLFMIMPKLSSIVLPSKSLPWCILSCLGYGTIFTGIGLYFFHRFDVK